MPGYHLTHDRTSGVVMCRILRTISESDAERLGRELEQVIAQARLQAPALRIFWDHREGGDFASPGFQALIARIRSNLLPGDRTATLVSSSLLKGGARQDKGECHEVFISENAAMTWLTAWQQAPAVSNDAPALRAVSNGSGE